MKINIQFAFLAIPTFEYMGRWVVSEAPEHPLPF